MRGAGSSARAEYLALSRRFDVVLLASQLIDADDDAVRMEYVDGDRVWTPAFTARRLDDAALAGTLGEAGLPLDRYLTEDAAGCGPYRPEPGDRPGGRVPL